MGQGWNNILPACKGNSHEILKGRKEGGEGGREGGREEGKKEGKPRRSCLAAGSFSRVKLSKLKEVWLSCCQNFLIWVLGVGGEDHSVVIKGCTGQGDCQNRLRHVTLCKPCQSRVRRRRRPQAPGRAGRAHASPGPPPHRGLAPPPPGSAVRTRTARLGLRPWQCRPSPDRTRCPPGALGRSLHPAPQPGLRPR